MSVVCRDTVRAVRFLPFLWGQERNFYDRSSASIVRGTVGTVTVDLAQPCRSEKAFLGTQRFLPIWLRIVEFRASLLASPPVRGESDRRKGGTELAGARTDVYKTRHADLNRSKTDRKEIRC